MIELANDNLDEVLNENQKVMVMYGAPWCGNCRLTKPKFKRMASENEDTTFVYVNAEAYPNSRSFANVSNLPTFASFDGGKLVEQDMGNKIEIIQKVFGSIK